MRPYRPRSLRNEYNSAYTVDDYEHGSGSTSHYADDLNHEHNNPDARTRGYYRDVTRLDSRSDYYWDDAYRHVSEYQVDYGASSSRTYNQRQTNYWEHNERSYWDTPSSWQRRGYHTSRPTPYSSASGPGGAPSSNNQTLSSMLFQHRDRVARASSPPSSNYNPPFQTPEHEQIEWMPSLRRQSQSRKTPMHPSSEYLFTSSEPSQKLLKPELLRKLLILDLNGTLVYRNPHSRSYPRPSPSSHRPSQGTVATDNTDPYSTFDPTQPHPLRVAHPRPYLQTFREYLFHPSTKRWLDTMVWSSAQPHSVAEMVGKCFGEKKDELVAVWARDKLGLSAADYSRKVQTTKDLTKPWNELNNLSSEQSVCPSSSVKQPHKHSARTTLLLDDSPLKAHLQPYSHVCIREYAREMWQRDLTIRELRTAISGLCEEKASAAVSEPVGVDERNEMPSTALADEEAQPGTETAAMTALTTDSAPEPEENSRKRKRKAKKEEKKKEKLMDRLTKLQSTVSATFMPTPEGSGSASYSDPVNAFSITTPANDNGPQEIIRATTNLRDLEREHPYDETLLAVIGILDAIKAESNVAAWLKSGGLVQGIINNTDVAAQPNNSEGLAKEERAASLPLSDFSSSASVSSTDKPSPKKKKKKSSVDVASEEDEAKTQVEHEETQRTGIPLFQSKPETENMEPLWFDRVGVQAYWANRGRSVCRLLGIDIIPGVSGQ